MADFCHHCILVSLYSRVRATATNSDRHIVPYYSKQGTLTLILKGEGSLSGLTSCPYRIYWLGISCISACKVFFQHQNNLVQTSKDRRPAIRDPSPFRI